jgi:uncharacterized RDD family membrane protein YckC
MSTSATPDSPTPLFCSKCGATVWATDAFCPNCAAPQNRAPAGSVAPVAYPQATQAAPRTYAGFWIRFLAIFIDAILISVVTSPVWMLNGLFLGHFPRDVESPAMLAPVFSVIGFAILISVVVKWLYEALMTSSSKQATIGKMVCGLIVTDTRGARLSFAHATGRFFAKYISTFTLLIGYIMAGFTERKQALHDLIAGTYVLKGKPTSSM